MSASCPPQENRAEATLVNRNVAAKAAHPQTALEPGRDVSEALVHQLLREVGSLRAETASLRRERGAEDAGPARCAAPVAPPRVAHAGAGAETSSTGADEDHVRRILSAALSPPPRSASSAEPEAPPADDDMSDFEVPPALHKAFFMWSGASGCIRTSMGLEKWAEATSKRCSMKEWRKRAKDAGVDIAGLPTTLRPMVKALLAEYRSVPGAVRSTAGQS